jgi:hypothetical protein
MIPLACHQAGQQNASVTPVPASRPAWLPRLFSGPRRWVIAVGCGEQRCVSLARGRGRGDAEVLIEGGPAALIGGYGRRQISGCGVGVHKEPPA